MRRLVFYLCIILNIFVPHRDMITGDMITEDMITEDMITDDNSFILNSRMKARPKDIVKHMTKHIEERNITSMEALDRVKEIYAANFEKVFTKDTCGEYYYKLPLADYYLVYEGAEEAEKEYVFHLYEFIIDEQETGIGHTVTYGWYSMNKESGVITDQTQ